jgi:hypothetical protein
MRLKFTKNKTTILSDIMTIKVLMIRLRICARSLYTAAILVLYIYSYGFQVI